MLRNRLFFAFCLVVNIVSSWAEYTVQDCRQLGFLKTQLMCSQCEKLEEQGLEKIKEHCLECCEKDAESPISKRYPKAVLEVCTCKFGVYPQIQAFVRSDRPSKFPNLSIKYVRGLDPIVKLLDSNGNVKETLSITKWNTDTVQEFFETHLEVIEKDEPDYIKHNEL